jgi:hypothetical protein
MRSARGLTLLALALALGACSKSRVPKGAEVVFDVDFSAPEQTAGSAVHLAEPGKMEVWPARVPSDVFFGKPTVVGSLCGLAHQPLQLTAKTGDNDREGVVFSLDPRWGHYHFELDACVDSLDSPGKIEPDSPVVIFIDVRAAHAIGFNPDGTIVLQLPVMDATSPPPPPKPIGRFEPKKPVHLVVDVDLAAKTMTVAIDGKVAVDRQPVAVDIPSSFRLMVRNNPSAVAGFDNVLIWGENDRFAAQEDSQEPEPPDAAGEPEHQD